MRKITDARTMRAVAHPTRLALLEVLAMHEQLTATEAGELVGESPTNCAFHLRTLAKYGFVEEAGEAPGRRRPWRLIHIGFAFDRKAGTDEESFAAQALSRLLWGRWVDRLSLVNAAMARFDTTWQDVTSSLETVSFVTPEEAEGLIADFGELLNRYRDRIEDPALRPAGSLPVETLVFSYPYDAVRPGN